jgi:O-antigen/teichoic acid export membrane protein
VLAAGDLPATLVFGDGYAGTGPVLLLLSLAVLVDALGITAGSGLSALERPGANFAAAVATLATEVALMFCLVVPLGVSGAALALLGGNVAGAAVRAGFLARALRARGQQPGGCP